MRINCYDNPILEEKVQFYSDQLKRPALRYEVGVCLRSGSVGWLSGPFPGGGWPNPSILRSKLPTLLGPGEFVIAGKGYEGVDPRIHTSMDAIGDRTKVRSIAQCEAIDHRIKSWACTAQAFRHKHDLHHILFNAVVAIINLEIQSGPY